LKIVWPDGKIEKKENIKANQTLVIKQSDSKEFNTSPDNEENFIFTTVKDTINFPRHKHEENVYDDFEKEILLPHRTSTFGPGLAVGDLNGDGKDDYFIGGAHRFEAGIFYQDENGGFVKQDIPALSQDSKFEDLGALIFDADGDGNNDLYVVSGGNEFGPDSEMLQDRLYINDGKGNFIKDEQALPKMITSGSKVY